MEQIKNICFITGTRAEYWLLKPIILGICQRENFQCNLIVTGAHLSEEFGSTIEIIEKDQVEITKKIPILTQEDNELGVAKSISIAVTEITKTLLDFKPNFLVILGDRYEALSAAISATLLKIPIVHLYGGEVTLGAYDDAFRHSITKMSKLHLTSTDIYKNRVIQMGEDPEKVFNVGSTAIDNITSLNLMNRLEFEESINFKMKDRNFLITYHPETLSEELPENSIKTIISVLDSFKNVGLIFTEANADNGGRRINQVIRDYVKANTHKAVVYSTLGEHRYYSALSLVDGVVGNSSSGIIEAPYFLTPSVNIGIRQHGRLRAESIIDCSCNEVEIKNAILQLLDPKFRNKIKTSDNPFKHSGAVDRIIKILTNTDFSNLKFKKFFDIDYDN